MATSEDGSVPRFSRISNMTEEPQIMLMPFSGYENMPLVTLEEAVEPLISILPKVQRYVYVAKTRCKPVRDHGLTQDESASIKLYTMDWEPHNECLFIVLNATLRTEDRRKLKPWFSYLKLILTALSRLPSTRQFIYQGVKMDLSKEYPKGKIFIWWEFSSCTSSSEVLESDQFLGKTGERTLFTIDCDSGKDIRRYSDPQSEEDILLLPARQFQVKSCLQPVPGFHIIHLIEIPSPVLLLEPTTIDWNPNKELILMSEPEPNYPKEAALHKFEEDMDKLRKEVGGNAGVPFVDLNDINGYKRVIWATNAPKWRIAVPGINLEGFCSNNTCEAYGKRVIIGIGMKTFDLLGDTDSSTCKCPMCKQYVDPTTCGFNNCYWRWEGIKQLPQQPPIRCSDDWKAADDAYHYFDQTLKGTATTSGTAIWRKLILEAKPPGLVATLCKYIGLYRI